MSYEEKAHEFLAQATEQLADAIHNSVDGSYQQDILMQVYKDACESCEKLRSYIVE